MPPFRFQFPSFSFGSPSRLSSGTSSPSPPPTPPSPSRPPFRPAGIAQPSKPATSSETKSKVGSSLSRAKSNVAAMVAALSGSQSPSRGPATPTRLAKQSNQQSGSPVKKPESLRTEEEKVTRKGKTSKESGETSIARSKQKEAEEAQEQSKKTELKKLAIQEKKKVLPKDLEEKSKAASEQQKKGEVEKLGVQEKKKVKDMEEKSKAAYDQHKKREVEKLGVQEKTKVLPKDMGDKSEAANEQQKKREDETLAVQESKTKPVLHEGGKEKSEAKGLQENREAAQGEEKIKEKEKLALPETQRALQATSREDATQSKTTGKILPTSGSTSSLRDQPETKTKPQNKTEIHTNDDNQHKTKGVTMSTHGNPRNKSREESSSISRKIKEDIRDGISKLTWGKSNGDEKSVSVITLTGENRGATMAIDSEKDKKSGEVPIRRGYKSIPNESPNTTTTETEEENKNSKAKNPKNDDKDEEEEAEKNVRAYVNGNTQGINNSIVLDSSVSENDPGIHMSMKFEESYKEIINPPKSLPEKKPQVQKPEPRVRRRCLRGLLAESSESETKPRRHGCKFKCKDKDIENA